ncbi:ATP-binding protein [Catenulispora sp. NL8]|uniref:ATP-binding protein n=1 Tax=Catenulispora pinistramenti TaxID=2705254 RepID=A0ABS5KLK1_9ACTN|nr:MULTISPECIES: ATP-binding protein [Catenulispora]MBS2546919.1 ATP-binding protein [Catenulispora pinistramenti]
MSYWSKSFEGLPEYLTAVREFTRLVAGDREGADVMEMVASELAGNAIQHSESGEPGGKFTLQVAGFPDRWQIRVIDEGGPTVPHICELPSIDSAEDLDYLGDEAEAGRGLAMIAAVSSVWGVIGDQTSRSVWAEILIPGTLRPERHPTVPEQCHWGRERR